MAVNSTPVKKEEKPFVLKVVRSPRGGYACYHVQTSMHPSAVVQTPWEVLDWLAERLADLEGMHVQTEIKRA